MATAAIGAGTSLISGLIGKGGAKKAGKAQERQFNAALNQQNQQFQQTRADNMPWLTAGQQALGASGDLLGLHGNDPMAAAIAALKASPAFTSLYDTGADTILQNAAATGGLRGGNTNNSLASFGSNLLATVIQNQLQNLGGMSSMGAGTAGNLGALGQNNASAVSNLLTQKGSVQANSILAQTGAMQSAIGGMGQAAGNFFGGQGIPANVRGW